SDGSPPADMSSVLVDPSTSTSDNDSPTKRNWNNHHMKENREAKVHQRIVFARLVHHHRKILFGTDDGSDRLDAVDPMAKETVWKWIAEQVKDLETFKGKSWSRLRDHDWQYIRRHAVTRYENNSIAPGPLGELDLIVIECINRNIHPLSDPPRSSLPSSTALIAAQLRLEPPLIESIIVKEEMPSTMDTLLASTEEAAIREEEEEEEREGQDILQEGPTNLVSSLLSIIKSETQVIPNQNGHLQQTDSMETLNGCTTNSSNSPHERAKKRKKSERNGGLSEWMSVEEHDDEMRRLERRKREIEISIMEREESRREEMHQLEIEHKRLLIESSRRSLHNK
ncbi:hypothetical protein PFISCL1PPCAC_5976, partial [Pristionchus fissidentatus]